jgi:hypothetical protein
MSRGFVDNVLLPVTYVNVTSNNTMPKKRVFPAFFMPGNIVTALISETLSVLSEGS